jgi:hypothetical protein
MLLLTTASTVLRVITSGSNGTIAIDVHASWIDQSGTTTTPGATNTAITSDATTTLVAAPGSGARNVKLVSIRNRSTTTTTLIAVQVYNGTTAYVLAERTLGPGRTFYMAEGRPYLAPAGGDNTQPWFGNLAGCVADGDPGWLMQKVQKAGWTAATPTDISTTIARCSAFVLPADMTVNRIRAYGIASTTGVYRVALYRYSTLARLCAETSFNTAAATWVSIGSALNVALLKDVVYFIAVSVNATGTTAGLACMGTTTTATTGNVATIPGSLPGSLAMSSSYLNHFQFQFAVTAGALPDPAATLAAPATWTGGMPAFWIDNSDT